MIDENIVSRHYSNKRLINLILDGLKAFGKSKNEIDLQDLASIDEFHIGGRQATEEFLSQLNIKSSSTVLDVGCGIGGSSRFVAGKFDCSIVGLDLTADYIDTGKELNQWVGFDQKIKLMQISDGEILYPLP